MSETIFLRLLASEDKAPALASAIAALGDGQPSPFVYSVDPASFRQVPGSAFAYWTSERVRQLFANLPPFESKGKNVQHGLSTKDDPRFLRLWWEVAPTTILTGTIGTTPDEFHQQTRSGQRWVPFAKGGTNSAYYADLHLVVNWANDGKEIEEYLLQKYPYLKGNANWVLHRESSYFSPGLTWPARPHKRGTFSHVPAGVLFSHTGLMLFLPKDMHWEITALLNSDAYIGLLHLLMPRGGPEGGQTLKYEIGYVASVPVPNFTNEEGLKFKANAINSYEIKRALDANAEISHVFWRPAILEMPGDDLNERISAWQDHVTEVGRQIAEIQHEIDDLAFPLYGIGDKDRRVLEESLRSGNSQGEATKDPEEGDEEEDEPASFTLDQQSLLENLMMYAVGCSFGRWDVRIGRDLTLAPPLANPFAPLPVCAPGALVGPDGLPARPGRIVSEAWLRARPDVITLPPEGSVAQSTIPDEAYPLSIAWDGILADDPDHEADILRRVRAELDLLWGERAEAIEAEACSILGVRDLRDYFRNPRNFFDYHIGRYSQSHRKAPIYWLLQSSKRNYALWLYYHRLDKDILFKALTNYVEPKLRLEESPLAQLRAQLAGAGSAGRAVKQLEKQFERQESLMAELYDFRDKLRRAADLQLVPDLNDGVVLNIAPLWELVPWSEARKYWEELRAGKYEWSSISKQLREREVI